jgi:hypothetical protein
MLRDDAKWRNQEVSMILKVPEGKSVFLDEKMKPIIHDIENVENMWDGDMVGKYWTMTADGLALRDSVSVEGEVKKATESEVKKKEISLKIDF